MCSASEQIPRSVELSIGKEFWTITCPECEAEFLLFGVIRYYPDPCFDEEQSIFDQVVCDYCPYCGADCAEADKPDI